MTFKIVNRFYTALLLSVFIFLIPPKVILYGQCSVNEINTNSLNNFAPQTDNGVVVWQGSLGFTTHIFSSDGMTTETVSILNGNTSTDNRSPQIDGPNIVWQGEDGATSHIYLYNGITVKKFLPKTGILPLIILLRK